MHGACVHFQCLLVLPVVDATLIIVSIRACGRGGGGGGDMGINALTFTYLYGSKPMVK